MPHADAGGDSKGRSMRHAEPAGREGSDEIAMEFAGTKAAQLGSSMNILKTFVLLIPLVVVTATSARDASACGGCFVPPAANTQVTGHRMVLSVSPTETTLWDQIAYSGEPESFAWVLPTKGIVDVGISSDLLFNTLAFITDPQIIPPYLDCPYSCNDYGEGD